MSFYRTARGQVIDGGNAEIAAQGRLLWDIRIIFLDGRGTRRSRLLIWSGREPGEAVQNCLENLYPVTYIDRNAITSVRVEEHLAQDPQPRPLDGSFTPVPPPRERRWDWVRNEGETDWRQGHVVPCEGI